jgi:hypothetical protein
VLVPFNKKKFEFFSPACKGSVRATLKVYFYFIFIYFCLIFSPPTQGLRWQLSFHGWGHEKPGYIRMLYYEHEAGNSGRRFEVRSKWIWAGKASKEEGQGGGG